MILIQSYQELYYALKILQILKESEDPNHEKILEMINDQIRKLL